MLKDGIETHQGKTNPHMLVIAPHGYPDNDENTGDLVRSIQKILDCSAIINEFYRKPKLLKKEPKKVYEKYSVENRILNLNYRPQAEKFPYYIDQIQQSIKDPASTIVVWIHGIDDKNLKEESKELSRKERLHCLIGYGQPDHLTCHPEFKDIMLRVLNAAGIKSDHTRKNAENYRGFEDWNMNRWFKVSGKGLEAVQSIQLELGYAGVRDPDSIERTAKKLARALLSLTCTLKVDADEKEADEALVVGSLNLLSGYCNEEHHGAMQQAGEFIIEGFYGGDPQRLIDKNPVRKKSLFSLITKLQEGSEKVPSKSWFYNARALAAHEQIFKKRGFQIFGNLGHSHKLALLHVRSLEKIETLATQATKRGYNVQALKTRIKEEEGSSGLNLDKVPTKAELAATERKALLQLQKKAATKIEHYQKKLAHFQKCLEKINDSLDTVRTSDGRTEKIAASSKVHVAKIERKKTSIVNDSKDAEHKEPEPTKNHAPAAAKSPSGFQEWAGKTFIISTGCENDCIYCWAKERAYRFRQVAPGKWNEPIIRQHDVERKHRYYGVRVAFPSTHDILPSNINDYLTVLRKLLDAGNEVLIVSKPRIDCIRAICEAAKDFKKQILFRFTIGAMDDEILSFWEPNAPRFLERAESLRYAFDQGFKTSVSTEPMLQAYAIEAMVNKLLPHVNDTMWIGKMNYLGRLKKKADEALMERIAEIEQGQTDDIIRTIYNQFKNNPKIKWKDSIKKVVGLEAPREPGMDV